MQCGSLLFALSAEVRIGTYLVSPTFLHLAPQGLRCSPARRSPGSLGAETRFCLPSAASLNPGCLHLGLLPPGGAPYGACDMHARRNPTDL
jgi:hypothetical protein